MAYVARSSSGSVPISRRPSARQLHGLVDHVQVAQAEEVHLQQAELDGDVVHPELGHDFLVGALLLEGTTSISGPAPITTPAAWIESARGDLRAAGRGRGSPSRPGPSPSPAALRPRAEASRRASGRGPSGTSFAIRSTTPYVSSTRPASRIAARCHCRERMIWATRSRPYFSAT